jgi:hypothetical protein
MTRQQPETPNGSIVATLQRRQRSRATIKLVNFFELSGPMLPSGNRPTNKV